jgi:hypothetical protein
MRGDKCPGLEDGSDYRTADGWIAMRLLFGEIR